MKLIDKNEEPVIVKREDIKEELDSLNAFPIFAWREMEKFISKVSLFPVYFEETEDYVEVFTAKRYEEIIKFHISGSLSAVYLLVASGELK